MVGKKQGISMPPTNKLYDTYERSQDYVWKNSVSALDPRSHFTRSQNFRYKPLDSPGTSIRVLEVVPEPDNSQPLRLGLREVQAPELVSYRCLSYMWGPPTDELHEVYVNGRILKVRPNLYAFLRTVSRRFPKTPLWIDAICINQEDDVEKAEQVSRMADIYHAARETLIWLGSDAQVIAALRDISGMEWEKGDRNNYDNLCRLYADPYWSRAWICQEIIQSKELRVCTTRREACWTDVVQALEEFNKIPDTTILDNTHQLNPSFYINMRKDKYALDQDELLSIWDLLYRMRMSQCRENRDRIYSLLSLVRGGEDFSVSYTEPYIDIFWRAGEHFCAWTRPYYIDILRRALGLSDAEIDASLEHHTGTHLSIPIQSFSRYPYLPFQLQAVCKRSGCRKHRLGMKMSRDDILLCTRTHELTAGFQKFSCVHFLVRPVKDCAQRRFDLVIAIHFGSAHIEPKFTKKLESSALQHHTWNGLKEAKDWPYIEKCIKDESFPSEFRVNVSAALVIELYRSSINHL